MSESEKAGRSSLDSDVHFKRVGDSLYYTKQTEHSIDYVPIVREDLTLGYLWYNDEDAAAGYIPRPLAGDDAFNAGVSWSQELRGGKARGLTPSQAVLQAAANSGNSHMGWAHADESRHLEHLASLKALAEK